MSIEFAPKKAPSQPPPKQILVEVKRSKTIAPRSSLVRLPSPPPYRTDGSADGSADGPVSALPSPFPLTDRPRPPWPPYSTKGVARDVPYRLAPPSATDRDRERATEDETYNFRNSPSPPPMDRVSHHHQPKSKSASRLASLCEKTPNEACSIYRGRQKSGPQV